jgi:hypothetical protein
MITVLDYGAQNAKWDKVRKSLDVINVDANTATVLNGDPTGEERVLLRTELGRLGRQYHYLTQIRTPTAREFVGEIVDNAKKVTTARDLFAPTQWPMGYLIGNKRAAEIHCQLSAVEAELQKVEKLVREGAYAEVLRYEGRQGNASKSTLLDYLLRLVALWDELVGEAGETRHRNYFVWACAAAAGVTIKQWDGEERLITTADVRYHLSSKKKKTKI